MVRGLDIFKEYFGNYSGNYVIIGGTACDTIISNAGFNFRATRDIDIILVVETLNAGFIKHFWQFIKDGNYARREKSEDSRKYYRFSSPKDNLFPIQIEIFARNPDLLELDKDIHLIPIPVDDDLSSLSAILLNDDYYSFTLAHSSKDNGLHIANTEALICLKVKAFLEIYERISNGKKEEIKQLGKHKRDVFRLAVMLKGNDIFKLPATIKADLQAFCDVVSFDLPGKEIFEEMGLGRVSVQNVLNQIFKSFDLNNG